VFGSGANLSQTPDSSGLKAGDLIAKGGPEAGKNSLPNNEAGHPPGVCGTRAPGRAMRTRWGTEKNPCGVI